MATGNNLNPKGQVFTWPRHEIWLCATLVPRFFQRNSSSESPKKHKGDLRLQAGPLLTLLIICKKGEPPSLYTLGFLCCMVLKLLVWPPVWPKFHELDAKKVINTNGIKWNQMDQLYSYYSINYGKSYGRSQVLFPCFDRGLGFWTW